MHIFCDGALGTNIAVYLDEMDAPLAEKYELGKRFWQSQEWANDVVSFAWLKNGAEILVSTSHIYGMI